MANFTDDCLELMLNDIVEVRLFESTTVAMPIPVNVPEIGAMAITIPTSCTLSMVLKDSSDADAQLTEEPTLKVTESVKKSGLIYTFDISCTIDKGLETVRSKMKALTMDHHLAIKLSDGTWRLGYILPNTISVTLEDNVSTGTIKIGGSSLSSVIKVS